MATLEVTAEPTTGPLNMLSTFRAQWSDGRSVNAAEVTWSWTPDTLPGRGPTAKCGDGTSSCQGNVKESGTMSAAVTHNGVVSHGSVHVTILPPCPTPNDSVLSAPEVRDALGFLYSTNHVSTNPLNRREQLAFVMYNTTTHEYAVQFTPLDPTATPCRFNWAGPPPRDSLGFHAVAALHNHPLDPGVDVVPAGHSCQPNFFDGPGEPVHGLSPHDQLFSNNLLIPVYAIDKDNIYRGDGTVSLTTPRTGTNGCLVIQPVLLNRKAPGVFLQPTQSKSGKRS